MVKRGPLLISVIITLAIFGAISVIALAPNPGHTASQIYIKYSSNCYVSLQNAVNNEYLSHVWSVVSPAASDCKTLSQIPNDKPWALASNVLLTIKGQKMTLQEAVISDSIGNSIKSLPGGAQFTTSLNSYENASKIILSDGARFTDSLNSGAFVCNPSCSNVICGDKNACGTTCNSAMGCTPRYSWTTGAWTGSNTYCGAVQYRQITCMDAKSGSSTDPSKCDINSVPNNKRTLNCAWVETGTQCGRTTISVNSCSVSGSSIVGPAASMCFTSNIGATKTCNTGNLCGNFFSFSGNFGWNYNLTQSTCQSNWAESFVQYIWVVGSWSSFKGCSWTSTGSKNNIAETAPVSCENLLTGGSGGNNCDPSIKPSGVRYPTCSWKHTSTQCVLNFGGPPDCSNLGQYCVEAVTSCFNGHASCLWPTFNLDSLSCQLSYYSGCSQTGSIQSWNTDGTLTTSYYCK